MSRTLSKKLRPGWNRLKNSDLLMADGKMKIVDYLPKGEIIGGLR
jgi:hypothetical protein